ncbi:hypothetical protein ABZY44_36460 [Streptomyces sp. NPDC006544]|uniref:hypothetical protein n=1 Tax=Streptomyces sp. NPDC006544 TaxID=3154583 RepID=UPI0033A5DA34
MDEQGGAGGVPLHDEEQAQTRHRKPHAGGRGGDRKTAAADTDEASRLDRPERPGKSQGEGTRGWVGPRDDEKAG